MDTVFIEGLRVDAIIGVYDWERSIRQQLVLDVELAADNRRAASGDRIEDAVDYAAISARLIAHIKGSECQLIETLAEQLAAILLEEFAIAWLRLRLAKPGAVAQARTVGVVIERGERA